MDSMDINITKPQIDKKYDLTAIVLVYNGEKFLKPCLNSLVNQTLTNLEILLINDASTDDSLSICKEYERDYDNVFVIDKKENGGLASSANLGIKLAKGEYIILVDNDDIVPSYAYEKLYNKAKECDADISIGQAVLLHGSLQHEISSAEQRVWSKERIIHDVNEFPVIFHDAFYWNKIIKKSLLIDNNIELPLGMIYADRKFSHTAYIHAKTISIIPDCVYMWRIRKNDKTDESLSIRRKEAWNYINRIDSYEIDLDKLINKYPDYFKILMRRVIVPIRGILESEEFKNAFYERGLKLLKEECFKLNNIYDNDLSNLDNIFLYLALNDYKSELEELLKLNISKQRELYSENGKTYWKLPLFRNSNIEIPDNLFEIKYLNPHFLNIEKIITTKDLITFEGIELPEHFEISKGEIVFIGRTKPIDKIIDNSFAFEIEKIEDSDKNLFRVEIPTDNLRLFEVYEIFFKAYHNDDIYDKFRLSNELINEIIEKDKEIVIFKTKFNKLSLAVQKLYKNFTIETDKNGIKIVINDVNKVKRYLKILVKDLKTNEETLLALNENNTEYYLEWEFFLDEKSKYLIQFKAYTDHGKNTNRINLNTKHLIGFEEITLKTNDGIKVDVLKRNNSDILLKSN